MAHYSCTDSFLDFILSLLAVGLSAAWAQLIQYQCHLANIDAIPLPLVLLMVYTPSCFALLSALVCVRATKSKRKLLRTESYLTTESEKINFFACDSELAALAGITVVTFIGLHSVFLISAIPFLIFSTFALTFSLVVAPLAVALHCLSVKCLITWYLDLIVVPRLTSGERTDVVDYGVNVCGNVRYDRPPDYDEAVKFPKPFAL